MALVTAAYLTVEIPFSVRLVEVMGGDPSQADIDALEDFGRVLTGVAVAIWAVGSLVLPRLHARGRSLAFSLLPALAVGAASVWGTYTALDAVAHSTGRSASGEERKEAFVSGMAARSLAGGFGDLAPSSSNDWNTFVAVLPDIAGADALVAAAGMAPERLAEAEAERRTGSLEDMREAVFGEGFASVRNAYATYEEGSREYLAARSGLRASADRAWNEFQAEVIARYGKIPGDGFTHASIVRKVMGKGIPVHGNWKIWDKGGFTGPYMKAMSEKIEAEYARNVEYALGKGERLKAGLGMDAFASHPAIQERIRRSLGLPAGRAAIVPGMDAESFRRHVYEPKLQEARSLLVAAVRAHPSEFEDGEYASLGMDAVKAARLPAMAILLSIAGAALHIFKFSGYAVQMASAALGMRQARGGMRHVWGAAATAAAFAAFVASGNGVTGTASYAGVKSEGAWQSLLEGAIAIQPAFSDAGRALGGIGGWQAFAADMPQPVRMAAAPEAASPAPAAGLPSAFAMLPDGSAVPLPSPAPR